ncbi:MAG: hypothetical protein KY455_01365 [Euryarchaeota archaeon]|nr:hypothetical protein [Euryarchaeota archaeon]
MRAPTLAVLLVSVLFAGCVSDAPAKVDGDATAFLPDWSERALPFGDDHDHTDPLQHANLSTRNFEVIGRDPLASPHYDGKSAGGYLCGDGGETIDGRRLAIVESRSEVGFAVADVTDATAPKWLGELVMKSTYVYDVGVVPDGRHVALVTSNAKTPSAPATASTADLLRETPEGLVYDGVVWQARCADAPVPLRWAVTEDPLPRPVSLLLVDISDPTQPTVVDQRPLPGFGHSVVSKIMDGRTLLLVGTVASPNAQQWQFYEVLQTPLGGRLHHVSTYTAPPEPDPQRRASAIGGHTDGWMQKHPATGQSLAYLVGGPWFIVLDISDPETPKRLGMWSDVVAGREGAVGNLHSAFPLRELVNGRHYTVIGPEFGGHPDGMPSGVVWVLDTTDPNHVFEVAAWTLPHEVDWSGTYMFSNHYLTAWNGTVFVSMYHGGVWALDLSVITPGAFVQLPSVGVFMPVDPELESAITFRWTPTLEEALSFDDGTLLTFDSMTGLWTFRFDPSDPAPPPAPWEVPPVD